MRVAALALLLVGCEINPAFDPSIPASGDGGGMLDGDAAIAVGNLRATWATPNIIRWDWDADGDSDELLAFELVVGPTEQSVIDRDATTTTWTEADNPELGRFLLPKTGGEEPVVFTATDGLAPDTVYHAQLHATDTAGRESISNVAGGRTAPPPVGEIVIMSDEDTAGQSIPDAFVLDSERPYAGAFAYRYEASCPEELVCWENLRRHGVDIDLSAISEGAFATTAYFEVALAIEGGTTPWWCDLWLAYESCGGDCLAHYGGWTARADGEYRVLQVPMRAFNLRGEPTAYEELANGLFEFSVGCPWSDSSVVRVDELRFRW